MGLEEEWPDKGQQMIFVPPFHMLKKIQVADDLRHIIDTPAKALEFIYKIETKYEIKSLRERIENLQSFKIDGVSTLPKDEIIKTSRPWHGW